MRIGTILSTPHPAVNQENLSISILRSTTRTFQVRWFLDTPNHLQESVYTWTLLARCFRCFVRCPGSPPVRVPKQPGERRVKKYRHLNTRRGPGEDSLRHGTESPIAWTQKRATRWKMGKRAVFAVSMSTIYQHPATGHYLRLLSLQRPPGETCWKVLGTTVLLQWLHEFSNSTLSQVRGFLWTPT